MMKKLLALVFAMGIFMTSTIYASADTYHYSTLSIFHGETHTGQIREYDEGFAAITMDVDTIHKYYSSDNYCELNMKYKKSNYSAVNKFSIILNFGILVTVAISMVELRKVVDIIILLDLTEMGCLQIMSP